VPLGAAANRGFEAREGRRIEQRLERAGVALGEGFDDGSEAERAPAAKPSGSKPASAVRTAATPALAVGRTVARMPPGPEVGWEVRDGAGIGTTLSLPEGASLPMRGGVDGGVGGVNGSRAGGRSLPVRLPRTERSRRIRNTATSPIRMMS